MGAATTMMNRLLFVALIMIVIIAAKAQYVHVSEAEYGITTDIPGCIAVDLQPDEFEANFNKDTWDSAFCGDKYQLTTESGTSIIVILVGTCYGCITDVTVPKKAFDDLFTGDIWETVIKVFYTQLSSGIAAAMTALVYQHVYVFQTEDEISADPGCIGVDPQSGEYAAYFNKNTLDGGATMKDASCGKK